LISINPYRTLPIYTASIMDRYHHEDNTRLPPHVFAIANDCYKALYVCHGWITVVCVCVCGQFLTTHVTLF
jgi:myosin heavy subunit